MTVTLPTLTKPVGEYDSRDRQGFFLASIKAILADLAPKGLGTKFSGQQIKYAKRRASSHMNSLGF